MKINFISILLSSIVVGDGFSPTANPSGTRRQSFLHRGAVNTPETNANEDQLLDSPRKDAAIEEKMERLIKPRAYPLFLAEKAAEICEGAIKGITKPFSRQKERQKEKLVILGTGWGAASFLKDINTDLYDVTVISPRNYFLFTPMLAGASVGTVEFRSITQPIREVRTKVD